MESSLEDTRKQEFPCFFCRRKLLWLDIENGFGYVLVGPKGEKVYSCSYHPGAVDQRSITGEKK